MSAAADTEGTLVVERMRATPSLLRALAGGTTREQAWRQPEPGQWSIAEVVRHLAVGERQTFLPRLRRMVTEVRPRFDARAAPRRDDGDLETLLGAFEAARRQSVGILAALDAEGWRREGVSPSRGVLTVAGYARTMTEHDTEHLRQIHAGRERLGLLPKRCEARLALPLAEIVAAIRGVPERLAALAAGLTPAELTRRPRDGEWSLKEVMAHLLKVERDLFLSRLRRMAGEERPAFERFDPDAWAAERDHREGSFADDLAAFTTARHETVAFLESLPPAAGERLGLSSVFGPVRLDQYATHVVDHDLEHLGQMTACRAAVAGTGAPPPRG